MEKQALLEDIALSNSARGDRLAAIEQEEIRLILALNTLETQYGQELQLTESAARLSPRYLPARRKLAIYKPRLSPSSRAIRCSGWTSTSAPWRR